jgi:hypothetical protein
LRISALLPNKFGNMIGWFDSHDWRNACRCGVIHGAAAGPSMAKGERRGG